MSIFPSSQVQCIGAIENLNAENGDVFRGAEFKSGVLYREVKQIPLEIWSHGQGRFSFCGAYYSRVGSSPCKEKHYKMSGKPGTGPIPLKELPFAARFCGAESQRLFLLPGFFHFNLEVNWSSLSLRFSTQIVANWAPLRSSGM